VGQEHPADLQQRSRELDHRRQRPYGLGQGDVERLAAGGPQRRHVLAPRAHYARPPTDSQLAHQLLDEGTLLGHRVDERHVDRRQHEKEWHARHAVAGPEVHPACAGCRAHDGLVDVEQRHSVTDQTDRRFARPARPADVGPPMADQSLDDARQAAANVVAEG
jgi:hypothetical protein